MKITGNFGLIFLGKCCTASTGEKCFFLKIYFHILRTKRPELTSLINLASIYNITNWLTFFSPVRDCFTSPPGSLIIIRQSFGCGMQECQVGRTVFVINSTSQTQNVLARKENLFRASTSILVQLCSNLF